MSNYVQLDVWFQEDKLSALSSVLVEQGTTVEKRMQGVLLDMYEALVPRETQEAIRTRLDKEEAEVRLMRSRQAPSPEWSRSPPSSMTSCWHCG